MADEKDEKDDKQPKPSPESKVTTAASGIAAMFIRKNLENERAVHIPSLDIKIEKTKGKK